MAVPSLSSEAHRIIFAQQTPVPFGQPSAEPYTTHVMVARQTMCTSSSLELHFLDEGHPKHKSLADRFTSKWLHSKPERDVEVVNVIKIQVPRDVRERHEDYKKEVPNVRRRFHGTFASRSCQFYVGGPVCLRPDCGLCNICTHGFMIGDNVGPSPTRGNRIRWLMYGKGLYFSSVSGKANDFSAKTEKVGPHLNYDELVVYDPAAALPTHFVAYRV
ncbi:unnamed protein product [Ectocarpus sp. 12 AP-2014]